MFKIMVAVPTNDLFIINILRVINDNHDLLSLLLSEKGDFSFNYQLVELFKSIFTRSLNKSDKDLEKKKEKIFSFQIAVQAIGIITFWVHHFDEYTQQDIYEFITKDSLSDI
ncbi:TetR/AcrR family transcriptional regulator C-terminal domain-containing protein [Apilactobacillus apisilvae]|uniref:TetR/AcrR family transcriptional regulator C-terminal domain-containing protein n=1 Tax=Apilactobacillus apisilvae TaxID=2923364 RepID=A0ABY4PGB8_9LACO|nr:TetR/AcrR family transcriptional regulator C-terminal domain-containing protein [Apilactobacillus apisilvae]UQS84830.1 TetR/AcrR family transcriptional regulator C-terminal domain-containing protein [Apilactobacillus apisilvae]